MTNTLQIPVKLDVLPTGGRDSRVVTAGVPFCSGELLDTERLCVVTDFGECVPATFEVTSSWPDGSIRWCLIRLLGSGSGAEFILKSRTNNECPIHESLVVANSDALKIVDKDVEYQFRPGFVFPEIRCFDAEVVANDVKIQVCDVNGRDVHCQFESPKLEHSDDLSATVKITGTAETPGPGSLNITLCHHIFFGGEFTFTCTIHNPRRSLHKDGIWDLGDPGSIPLGKLELVIPLAEHESVLLRPEAGKDWISTNPHDELVLHQASSGGEHWQCPTHVNSNNENCIEFSGYRLQTPQELIGGERASPTVIFSKSIAMSPDEFWQNFPKMLSVKGGRVVVGLYPQLPNDHHEIQGGERKQHSLSFSLARNIKELQEISSGGVPAVVDSAVHLRAQSMGTLVGPVHPGYDALISRSLDPLKGIAAKREQQDEYGWRNFGDVVADHETLYHTDGSYFVSHYNNQYDCIYGFARQYLLTGDRRWFGLMDELARHVLDIDIYHTDEDRAEYNHGLFWHTDHYKKASTASHRTYSRDHYAQDWTGPRGGGPGSEHCYTSGLKLYFYITGNTDAKAAVIGLTEWITHYYEGTGTLIEFCKSLLSEDLKKLAGAVRGKRSFKYRYGFDRGVGNYIRALLDSYELTSDRDYLIRAEHVIVNTFGASDDIAMRDLGNIELTWFYSVFLQEIVRYLDIKRINQEFDQPFVHARDGLLLYAAWMADNETPYLEQPEILEYPNDTWAAQDIRKANVLFGAYQYAVHDRDVLLERARYFRDYVVNTLKNSETLHFSRIQAVLLQNHGPSGLMDAECQPYAGMAELTSAPASYSESLYGVRDFFASLRLGLMRVIRTSSLRREIQWIKTRTAS